VNARVSMWWRCKGRGIGGGGMRRMDGNDTRCVLGETLAVCAGALV
jgi:hypothetical protein